MSYYLIGIGGTGAKCMEAFVHLCGAGLLKDAQSIKMIFVDADVTCGNLQRTQKAVEFYNKAQSIGFGDTGIFKNNVYIYEPWTPVPKDCKNMDDVFQRNSMGKKNRQLSLLYDALFNIQERQTSLYKGFRGHPAIGAAVMSHSIMMNKDKQWLDIEQSINTDNDAKVFIFASVFGGTGAAGFPNIAKILKNDLKKDENGNALAKIGGALLLPYFQFPTAPSAEEKEMQANVKDFIMNTKSALDYYDKSGLLGSVFQSIYMVGDNYLTEMKEFSLGADSQKNDACFIELYAALAAFDFFNKNNYEKADTPMIARSDDSEATADKVMWEDLPDICTSGHLKDKLAAYIRFLYAYRNCILVSLKECATVESAQKNVPWYIDLLKKAGKVDVYHERDIMKYFEALGDYADSYFAWWKQIVQGNDERKVELLNKQLWESSNWEKNKLDIYQVVLPVTERKDKLTYQTFWKGLCSYTNNLKTTSDSGSTILMRAAYELCTK